MRRYISHPRVGRQRYGPVKRVRSSRSTGSLPFRRSVRAVGLNDIHPMRRGGVKSIVDDFVLGRGVVISRAATSLRSVETQPLTRRFVRIGRTHLRFRSTAAGLETAASSLSTTPNTHTRLLVSLPTRYQSQTSCIIRYAGSNPAPGFKSSLLHHLWNKWEIAWCPRRYSSWLALLLSFAHSSFLGDFFFCLLCFFSLCPLLRWF